MNFLNLLDKPEICNYSYTHKRSGFVRRASHLLQSREKGIEEEEEAYVLPERSVREIPVVRGTLRSAFAEGSFGAGELNEQIDRNADRSYLSRRYSEERLAAGEVL